MPFDIQILEGIKGFLDPGEAARLYELGLEASRLGPCLEIGGYCGKSTVCLGAACRENGAVLFSVDHHRGSEEQQPGEEYFDPDLLDPQTGRPDSFRHFRHTIEQAGLEDTVVPMVCRSELPARAWSIRLGLVFIDGGHLFADAFTDYSAWSGFVIDRGYLVIHDIFKDPAKGGQAPFQVYQQAVSSGLFLERPMTGMLGVLQRRPSTGLPEKGE